MAKNTETVTSEALEKERAALEAARKELEAAKAALEAEKAELEAKRTVNAAAPVEVNPEEERVSIFIDAPASRQDDPNLFVSVNGVNYLLPKGKKSEVPRYVYDEIIRSRIAIAHLDDTVRELKAKAQQPTAI